MKTVTLTGMMGSGKTTIATLLGSKLSLPVIDIDTVIEANQQKTVSQIFTQEGEEFFRTTERETILNVFKYKDTIISLGGGSFEDFKTREFLLQNSQVIYLKTSAQIILQRLENTNTRPLLSDISIEKIEHLIRVREKNYELAHHIVVTDNKSPSEIIQEILGVL